LGDEQVLNVVWLRNAACYFGGIHGRRRGDGDVADADDAPPEALVYVNGPDVFDKKLAGFFGPKTFLDGNAVGIDPHHKRVPTIQRNEKRDQQPLPAARPVCPRPPLRWLGLRTSTPQPDSARSVDNRRRDKLWLLWKFLSRTPGKRSVPCEASVRWVGVVARVDHERRGCVGCHEPFFRRHSPCSGRP
jgi:hypothetical protein